VSTSAFFNKRFRGLFGSDPPHEAFIGWYLSICSAENIRSELGVSNCEFPGLDPLIRFAEKRACLSISLPVMTELFNRELVSFWNHFDDNLQREWVFAYINTTSVYFEFPNNSFVYDLPAGVLASLEHAHKGDCLSRDISIMFFKYDALFGFTQGQGRGWQLSVPDQFYSIMSSEFDVECEIFASPINRRATNYFSLFESDSTFGSFGNFFGSPSNLAGFLSLMGNPNRLTVEANPPFQPLVMMRFAHRLTQLLSEASATGYDFMCICILPNWPQCDPILFLRKSPYLFHCITLPKGEHKFKPGWSDVEIFEADPAYWKNSETLVLFLGSDAARLRYNISETLEARIRQSWICDN